MAKKKKQAVPAPGWHKHIWWLVPLIAILVYIPSFNSDFTLDDVLIVEDNTLIRSLDKIPKIWTSHYWAGKMDANDTGLYRPLTLSTYAIQYSMHEKNAGPYHIFNILLHALACFLLMKLAHLLFQDIRLAALSGLLFAIHPIHTEAVCGIVGRAEILAAIFILLASISYHHWRYKGKYQSLIILLVSTAAAITSKEHGFMLPFILGLQEALYYFSVKKYQWNHKRTWGALTGVMLISGLLWMVRSAITGPTSPHEQWLDVDSSDRMATAIGTVTEYIGMHLLPVKLSADYWTDEVRIVGWGHLSALMSILFLFGLALAALWQRSNIRSFSWGILFFFLTIAPVSNILIAAGFLKAERILYIPSIGLIIGLTALLIKLIDYKKSLKIPVLVILGGLSVFFLFKTWTRQADWKNNYTLALATLKTSPNSPRFNNMMGLELKALKRSDEALAYFEKAVRSNPNHVPALVNLANAYKSLNRFDEAAGTLERALKIDPTTLATYVNLMSVYRAMEDYDKNLAIAKKAVNHFPQSAAVLWNAANAYQLKNDSAKANELRTQARVIDPNIGM